MEYRSESEEQTLDFAATLAKSLRGGDVITLEGPLGAGKTCFVRGMAKGMGLVATEVSSPTFVICQEYSSVGTPLALVHIDAFRLSGPDELESIGWNELLESPDTVMAIEWPSRVQAALPDRRIDILMGHEGEHSRSISIRVPPDLADRFQGVKISPPVQSLFKCRRCDKPVDRSSPTFPFCSPRCRMADLGRWFNEGYRLTRPAEADEELED